MSIKPCFHTSFVRRLPQILAVLILLGGALAQTPLPAAQAAPLQAVIGVTTTVDEYGENAGACSLREAIQAANTNAAFGGCPAGSGVDSINLPAGTYRLTRANAGGVNEDNNATGDLDINASLTLTGAGAGSAFIQAGTNANDGIDKVFGVNPYCNPGVSVLIEGVTIRYGRNTQPYGMTDFSHTGGGLDWCGSSATDSFTLRNSVVSDNTNVNGYGGGLNIDSLSGYIGDIIIDNVTFQNNRTTSTANQRYGGALSILGYMPDVIITNSTFTGNQTSHPQDAGGAIYFRPGYGGSLSIHGSTINGNTASVGNCGGIAIDLRSTATTVTIDQNTQITNNTAGGFGGGICMGGTTTNTTPFMLSNLLISGNTATGDPGGGMYVAGPNATVQYSRIVSNTASTGTGLFKTTTAGSVTAFNNWWGCSTDPGAAPCNMAVLDTGASGLVYNPWLRNQLTSSPSTLATNQTGALTASFLTNSAGGAVAVGNLGQLIGQSVNWNNSLTAVGTLSAEQTTIQASGTATANFQAIKAGSTTISTRVDNDSTSAGSNVLSLTVTKANTTTTITSDSPDPSPVGAPVTVEVSVTGQYGNTPTAPTGTVTVSAGTETCSIVLPATSCELTFTTSGPKTITATYPGDANFNAGSDSADHMVDMPPTVTIDKAAGQADPTNTSPVNFTVVFSEPVTGFATGDVTLGGTAGATTGTVTEIAPNDGATYNVAVTGMTGSGTVTASVSAGVALDSASQPNTASTSTDNNVTYDVTLPGVTIARAAGQALTTNAGPVNFTVIFDEVVTGFATGDVDLSASTVSGTLVGTVSGGPATYNVAVSGMTGSGTVVASVPAGVAQDTITNLNTASPSAAAVTYDDVPPNTDIDTYPTNPSSSASPSFSFTGSDGGTGVTGFECALDGGFSSCTSPKDDYTGLSDGSHTFQVRAVDAAGNTDPTPDTYTWVVDATPPDTAIASCPLNPTSSTAAVFEFSGSDTGGTGVDHFDCRLGEGSFSPCTSPKDYTGLSEGGYTFEVQATDIAGNTDPTPASCTWTVDTTGPSVTMSSTAADPTNTSPISVTVQFSEAVNGFAAGDITPTNGTVDGFAVVDGDTYIFNLTPSGQGLVTADIAAEAAVDAAGNESAAAPQFSRTYDSVAPTVTINQADGQADPTGSSPVNFTVVFSEPVTGFATGDVTLGGTAGATTGTVTGGPSTYNVAVSGMAAGGTIVVSIAPGVAQDDASNGNTASSSTDNTVAFTFDTTTTLDTSSNPAIVGQTVTFTATVASAGGTPTGTVEFFDGATSLGTGTLNAGGQASLSASALGLGSHSITAHYLGSAYYITSTSSAVLQQIDKASTTTITTSGSPSLYSTSVTFTATVAVVLPGTGTPTGTVEFTDGATSLGSVTLSGGTATLTTSTLAAGAHTITASYGGDDNRNLSSGSVSQTVNKAGTTTTITTSGSPSTYGDSVTFTATVTVVPPGTGTPTGAVEFFDGATSLGTVPLSGGSAALATSTLTAGPHDITAAYGGDPNYNASSGTLTQTVLPAVATAEVASGKNPSVFGEPVTFTATVTSGAGTPTGTVEFLDGVTSLGTTALSSGSATLTTSTLSTGTHPIWVVYGGNTNYSASVSASLDQVVAQAGTETTLTDTPDPSVVGETVTFNYTVSVAPPGSGTLTGNVTVSNGTDTCTDTVEAGFCAITLTTPGASNFTATYPGDTDYTGSTSAAAPHTVNEAPAITSANNVTFVAGNPGTFTITTAGTPTPAIAISETLPTGVTFTDNGDGTATLAGAPALSSVGPYNLTFTASNGVPPDAAQAFTLTVDGPPGVSRLDSVPSTSGGEIVENEYTSVSITQLLVSYNKSMNPTDVGFLGNYTLMRDDSTTVVIDGVFYEAGTQTAVLNINGGVALPNGKYTLTVSGQIEDTLGAPIGTDFVRTFFVDQIVPAVSRIDSVASTGGGEIAEDETTNAAITQLLVVFNEAVNPAAAQTAGSYGLVRDGSTAVDIDGVTYDAGSHTATLDVNGGAVLPNGTYALTVNSAIDDMAGTSMEADFVRTFSVDLTVPGVSRINSVPATSDNEIVENEHTNSAIKQLLVVFSKDVDAADAQSLENYSLVRGGSTVVAIDRVTYDPLTHTAALSFKKGAALTSGRYTLTVSGAISDNLGTPVGADFVRTFYVDQRAPRKMTLQALPTSVSIENGKTLSASFSQIQVTFDEDVNNPAGDTETDDVTNPHNYLLVTPGPNGVVDTASCAVGTAVDDTQVEVGPVTYSNNGGAGPFVATVKVNNGSMLANGSYKLFLCGTTSIVDPTGNPLNGGMDDATAFTILTASAVEEIPDTGFAPGVVTRLPEQPAEKAYTSLGDLWIEIPALDLKATITGVPLEGEGWDVTWLYQQVGWLEGTAYPTWQGNTVLTAHAYTADGSPGPFAFLQDLKYGDTIVVHLGGMTYTYAVRSSAAVKPTNISWLTRHEELDWITLITCQQYDEKTESYRFRRVVRAVLVEVEEE